MLPSPSGASVLSRIAHDNIEAGSTLIKDEWGG
jgi:hypothetical protein